DLREEIENLDLDAAAMLVGKGLELAIPIGEAHPNDIVTNGRCARNFVEAFDLLRILRDKSRDQGDPAKKCIKAWAGISGVIAKTQAGVSFRPVGRRPVNLYNLRNSQAIAKRADRACLPSG